MAEKVLHEMRIIETEDGFRIEIKGDKEQIKKMGFGRMMQGQGRGFGFGRWHHGGHGGFPFQRPQDDEENANPRF